MRGCKVGRAFSDVSKYHTDFTFSFKQSMLSHPRDLESSELDREIQENIIMGINVSLFSFLLYFYLLFLSF